MLYSKDKIEKLRHRWTTPTGKKTLKTIKQSKCYLSPILFRQQVHNFTGINDPEVKEGIDLRGAPLSGFDFRVPIQENDEGFSEELVLISNIHFEGAMLKHCDFQDGKIYDCSFDQTELGNTDFNNTTLNNCTFREANCVAINLRGSKLVACDFLDTIIKDISLNTTIVDEKTTFGKRLNSEKEKNYHFASIEYKQIKEMYKNSSLHSISDKYHYKEMVARRKISKPSSPKRWLNYFFGDLLCKYGTSFNRVLGWSMGVILICSLLFTRYDSLLFENEHVKPSFANSLYFSIVTFTTLGYGDYHAVGLMRFVAALESFLGAALMALFTVIVARNIIRD